GAGGEEGGPRNPESNHADVLGGIGAGQLLQHHGLQGGRGTPPAVGSWPGEARIARLREGLAPAPRGVQILEPGATPAQFGGKIGPDPGAEPGPEFSLSGSVSKLHGAPPRGWLH